MQDLHLPRYFMAIFLRSPRHNGTYRYTACATLYYAVYLLFSTTTTHRTYVSVFRFVECYSIPVHSRIKSVFRKKKKEKTPKRNETKRNVNRIARIELLQQSVFSRKKRSPRDNPTTTTTTTIIPSRRARQIRCSMTIQYYYYFIVVP